MMNPCENCHSNKWAYKVFDGIVHATCDECGHKVEFKSKVKEHFQKELQEGDGCVRRDKNCPGKIFWYTGSRMNAKRLKKSYHYEKWLKCDVCGTPFLNDRYKILHILGDDWQIRFRSATKEVSQ